MSILSKSSNEVKPKNDAAKDLKELFVDSLKDIYWAEKKLTKALPKMAENAHSDDLKTALDNHLEETEGHVDRLEEVFDMIDEEAEAKKCEAMAGIVDEGEDILKETEPGAVRDAGIIAAGQKAEHYEIASYGTLVSWAKQLNLSEVAVILHQTLEEEKAADEKLASIATSQINKAAKSQ